PIPHTAPLLFYSAATRYFYTLSLHDALPILLELGNGFTFVARQKRISFDDKHFRIDLVFYNRILKCFVLIDLKIGELKHQDIGRSEEHTLNSSHVSISYAVFCLKKKNKMKKA